MVAIPHLLTAINTLVTREQVSSLHSQFALLCLKAKCLQHALPVISHSFTQVQSDTPPLDIMTYNYYRGSIFMALEMFEQAMEAFRKVLTQPANVFHQVHADAYDRVSILSLVVHGKKYSTSEEGVN